jgi:hypothetical protein
VHPVSGFEEKAIVPKFTQVHDGEWVQPIRKGYKMCCCDCGLVHTLDFRIVSNGRGNYIQFRASRNNRSTALSRRAKKKVTVSR